MPTCVVTQQVCLQENKCIESSTECLRAVLPFSPAA